MIITKQNRQSNSKWLIVALGLILHLICLSVTATAASEDPMVSTPETTATQAPFSWEQTQVDEIPGPGAFFDSLLTRLSRQSDDSEDRFKNLWEGVPEVLPDLFKVFITL